MLRCALIKAAPDLELGSLGNASEVGDFCVLSDRMDKDPVFPKPLNKQRSLV